MELSEYNNADLLELITAINADLYGLAEGSDDDFLNWLAGKKTTALELIEKFTETCYSSNGSCPTIPSLCVEYIKEINIQNLKELKAYFIWEDSGKNNNDKHEMDGNYFKACDEILFFCEKIKSGISTDCSYYNDIIKIIDRRKKERRSSDIAQSSTERRRKDRRKNKALDIFFCNTINAPRRHYLRSQQAE